MDTGARDDDHAPGLQLCRHAALLLLLTFSGCASPGPPRPPSLNLPEVVTTLAAQRVGDQVQLDWTTPEKTTDGLDVRSPIVAVVCRRPAVSPVQSCRDVLRLPVVSGASSAVDSLPSTVVASPAVALEYRLQLLNSAGRSAGESNAVLVANGPAPASPEGLQVNASQEGAVLTWHDTGTRDAVELRRIAAPRARSAKQSAFGAAKVDANNVVLRVAPGNGALDRTVVMDERYTYTAQRVRTITVEGRALEIRSAIAGPVTIEMRDVFPPRAPTGLEAVAAERVVDLSWEPNTEADLAGYFVLRRETGPAEQLNGTPQRQPSFQDKTAAPNHTYTYSVIAVDKAGNRSPAGEPVPVSIHADVP